MLLQPDLHQQPPDLYRHWHLIFFIWQLPPAAMYTGELRGFFSSCFGVGHCKARRYSYSFHDWFVGEIAMSWLWDRYGWWYAINRVELSIFILSRSSFFSLFCFHYPPNHTTILHNYSYSHDIRTLSYHYSDNVIILNL